MANSEFSCLYKHECPLVRCQENEIKRLDERVVDLTKQLRAAHERIGNLSLRVEQLAKMMKMVHHP